MTIFYKYKFQNKEWQDELGLNWYDFGGRAYMPDIVRTPQIDPMTEKFYAISPQSFLGNNPLYFIDPTGKEISPKNDDIITKVTNTRGDKHYKQRDVNVTMTLSVVNSTGADLSKTMFNKSSGNIPLSALSGNAQSDNRSQDITTSDNLKVTVVYKVVSSLSQVGKNDHVMVIADDIPKQKGTGENPVGLAERGGRVSAVEKGTIDNKTFNETATHEIGHLLGLSHTDSGLMNGNGKFGSTSTTTLQKGEIINGGEGQISPKTGNGLYHQSTGNSNYQTSIKSQANNFLSRNNIDW